MIRLLSLAALAWMIGFGWFAIWLPTPAGDRKTDAVVVLTGSAGRIDRGLKLLEEGQAKKMLISGVDRDVRPRELAARYAAPQSLFDCCVTLGREAVDTRSNAVETSQWLERRHYRSVRLITTDWHMRRAVLELRMAIPDGVEIITDAVPSRPSLKMLFKEYNKYLLRRAAALLGI